MADCASPCSAKKRGLHPASSDRIHSAQRMNCMLTSTGQPHHSVSQSNRCSTAPTARTAVVVCNESAESRYAPPEPPPSSSPLFLSRPPTLPSAGAEGTSLLLCRGIRPRFVVAPPPVFVCSSSESVRLISSASYASPSLNCTSGRIHTRAQCCGVTLGGVGGTSECPCAVAHLFSVVRDFPVAADTAPPGPVCCLPYGDLLTLEWHLTVVSRLLLRGRSPAMCPFPPPCPSLPLGWRWADSEGEARVPPP